MNKTIFAVLALLSVMVASVSGLDRLTTFCSDKGSYQISQDGFGTNLKRILGDLSSNIMRNSTSSPGFYNSSIENEGDDVFGQALCRGDVLDPKTCQNCVETASREILRNCSTRDAFIWYDLCLVRYSFQNFFSLMTYTGKYPEGDHVKGDVSVDPDRFGEYLNILMRRIVEDTVVPSNRMFATGNVVFSRDQTVFGLAQCTLDLTPDLCRNCLTNALGDLNACCSSRQGGFIVSRTCAMRFELYQFYNGTSKFYSTSNGDDGKWKGRRILIAIIASTSLSIILLFSLAVFVLQRKYRKNLDRDMINEQELLRQLAISQTAVTITDEGKLWISEELPFIDLTSVRAATDDFSTMNKIGQGGFGTVYKGVFEDGKEVAVKRLSRKSWQGLEEFKNEVILIAKLQHRNLVKLVGCSTEGDEKLLLYEFMPNRSLDFFIFDSERRSTLNWEIYYNIIAGISKGLVYLHEDSRPRIIHRDLKPNNVLLDHDMVAKISDFGMARIFCENQNSANTKRVVGTFGYMAPEYAMGGIFSVKSDVYSFGVILLEIISGQKNNGFYLTQHAQTLLSYAWKLWKEEKELEFVDPILIGLNSCPKEDIKRCIHIGLLCVQENPVDRPTMTDVVMLLPGSESIICSLPEPKEPAFSVGRVSPSHLNSTADHTVNGITMSDVLPR